MILIALLVLLAWLYLAFAHGRFWEATIPEPAPEPSKWPSVVAVVPARNEAETIQETVRGILGQDYPGTLSLVVVDDHSEDNTGHLAFLASQQISKADRITILKGQPLADGWVGKVWAMHQGWEEASKVAPDFIWFTDADIAHEPHALRGLVARAVDEDRGLTSTMVELRCEDFWEKALVPAFVYFFKLLYPFRWVNDPHKKTAGAAGGSMLARQSVLEKIKGPAAIKGALIDDCAFAKAIQNTGGTLSLNLTCDSYSLRGYPRASDAWNTIARTAYTQLGYNPWALAGSVVGLALLFIFPSLLIGCYLAAFVIIADAHWALGINVELPTFGKLLWFSLPLVISVITNCIIALSFRPVVRFYGLRLRWAFILPIITIFYLGATLDSARRYHRGSGGRWKGRTVERSIP